jgi:hypothetical protein
VQAQVLVQAQALVQVVEPEPDAAQAVAAAHPLLPLWDPMANLSPS